MSQEKGFQNRMKSFFKNLNKSLHAPRSISEEYFFLTEELENELKNDSPISIRLKAVKEIHETVMKDRQLETFTTEKLWALLEDLLKPNPSPNSSVNIHSSSAEIRYPILNLFTTLCRAQIEKNDELRSKWFDFIKNHNVEEDARPKFEFLKALTVNGRDVSSFEDKIGPFLLSCMGGLHDLSDQNDSQGHGDMKTDDFLIYLNNLMKFNKTCLSPEILDGVIQNICYIACASSSMQDRLECIKVLETVVCYPCVPQSSLVSFLATLCRTMNVELLCEASWKTVRHLLGTNMGFSGLLTMCQFMKTAEFSVIRGAVFFVGMSLWGNEMIRSLKCSPSTVLSSFQTALVHKDIYISCEVILRIQDLVKCNGDTLSSITWDLILEIIEIVASDIQGNENWKTSTNYNKIFHVVNETLDVIEDMVDSGGFSGALRKFYGVIETATALRPEPSVEKLLEYKQKTFLQCTMPNWLDHLISFTEKHYREERRSFLKFEAIQIIQHFCLLQLYIHEDELTEKLILPYFKTLDTEQHTFVRQYGALFLIEIVKNSTSKKSHDILSILEKLIHRPYDSNFASGEALQEKESADICAAINGIIDLFQQKIHQLPSCIAIFCYKILVRHLAHHYKRPNVLSNNNSIRRNIFNCFFTMRANSLYHLGFPVPVESSEVFNDGIDIEEPIKLRFSPYLIVDHRDRDREGDHNDMGIKHDHDVELTSINSTSNSNLLASKSSSDTSLASSTITLTSLNINGNTADNSSPSSSTNLTTGSTNTPALVTAISFSPVCKQLVTALQKEKDWQILKFLLLQIPDVLANKALIFSHCGNDFDHLATALCSMLMDKLATYFETLRNFPQRFSRSDFQSFVFPILASLVSYHPHLEPSVQWRIVKCLELGLALTCSRICILSLSLCALEMQEVMHKLLPEILLVLSKITVKTSIAIPILEFLSMLIQVPRIFENHLDEDQYMAIFATVLPLTNPFRFNQFTVSLAHQVIAMWFLKCPSSFRHGFVSYIIKGLETNVWAAVEGKTMRRDGDGELVNEDSSNRKRSSSLTDQIFKRKERFSSCESGQGQSQSQDQSQSQSKNHQHASDLQSMATETDEIPKCIQDKNLMIFHHELTETCIDIMARYTFADCSALPTKFQSTKFLFKGGCSQSWIVENKIITIITSGCTQKELRDGLCDKCWIFCRKSMQFDNDNANPYTNSTGSCGIEEISVENGKNNIEEFSSLRRRHRSAFADLGSGSGSGTGSSSGSSTNSFSQLCNNGKTKDDLHLDHKLLSSGSGGSSKGFGFGNSNSIGNQDGINSSCSCWCQGWAEVHIRRPTGNISWMMRVQNQLGNHSTFGFPVKELSALYRNAKDTVLKSRQKVQFKCYENENSEDKNICNGNSVENLSTPTVSKENEEHEEKVSLQNGYLHHSENTEKEEANILLTKSAMESVEDHSELVVNGNGNNHNLTSSPSSSKKFQASLSQEIPIEKTRVRRSNSSPEMSSSWKPLFHNYENKEDSLTIKVNGYDRNEISFIRPESLNGNGMEKIAEHAIFTAATSEEEAKVEIVPATFKDRSISTVKNDGISASASTIMLTSKPMSTSTTPINRHAKPKNKAKLKRMMSLDSSMSRGGSIISKKENGFSSFYCCETGSRSGISPAFIFLQLCSQGTFGNSPRPTILPSNDQTELILEALDSIPPYETHHIGIFYIAQKKQQDLNMLHGTIHYKKFLHKLGKLIKVKENDPKFQFLPKTSIGNYARIWQDEITQVIFHADADVENKNRIPDESRCEVESCFVSIVYNNSGEEYDTKEFSSYAYAIVIIEPLDHQRNRVSVKAQNVLANQIGPIEAQVVSDQNLPIVARQLAIHCNLASVIVQSMPEVGGEDLYASKWLERLRMIKRLRARVSEDNVGSPSEGGSESGSGSGDIPRRSFHVEDFTEFV